MTGLERLSGLLREVGIRPGPPEGDAKPDIPTVELPFWLPPGELRGDITLVLLCANQCVRDSGHECGVDVTLNSLIDQTWIYAAAHVVPWMVLTWGSHVHQLPFCCTSCLVEFATRRAAVADARHDHS